jgi:ElaB/YqjD/DUF883 family membrane-anchored ribosome-binding protein
MSNTQSRYGQSTGDANAEGFSDNIKKGIDRMQNEGGGATQSIKDTASDLAGNVSAKLKDAGVDTEKMANAAKGQVSELQKLIGDELQANPMRALGVAAAVGLVVGLITAR